MQLGVDVRQRKICPSAQYWYNSLSPVSEVPRQSSGGWTRQVCLGAGTTDPGASGRWHRVGRQQIGASARCWGVVGDIVWFAPAAEIVAHDPLTEMSGERNRRPIPG